MMLLGDGKRYVRVAFENEEELERVVVSNLGVLFGAAAVLLPKARLNGLGPPATVPDGIVIDLASKTWYILAVELASYGLWEQIAPRVAKQATAQAREEARHQILNLALDEVARSGSLKPVLKALELDERSMHWTLHEILQRPPGVALPIDEIPPDLDEWARTLKTTVRIWRLDKYGETQTGRILYALPDEAAGASEPEARVAEAPEPALSEVPSPRPAPMVEEIPKPMTLRFPPPQPAAPAEKIPEPAFLQAPQLEPAPRVEEVLKPTTPEVPVPEPVAKAEELAEPAFPLSPQEFRRRLNARRGTW